MKKLWLGIAGIGLAVSGIAAVAFGGWAVVSVDTMPEYAVAGRPLTFSFIVRQHGVSLLDGRSPRIEARLGGRRVEGRAWEMPQKGYYRASVTLPERGSWEVGITEVWGGSRGTLLVRAIDSTAKAPILADAERGRLLFAAKGCVTCHVHGDVGIEPQLRDFGPELTQKRFAARYLADFLADPSIKPPTVEGKRMPNFGLRAQEIASLVAFINDERKVSVK